LYGYCCASCRVNNKEYPLFHSQGNCIGKTGILLVFLIISIAMKAGMITHGATVSHLPEENNTGFVR